MPETFIILVTLLQLILIATIPHSTHCTMSLKDFYTWTNWNSRHSSPFKAKFTHGQVMNDHQRVALYQNPTARRRPLLSLPKSNHRVLTIYTLTRMKTVNASLYQTQWNEYQEQIKKKKFTVAEERIRELELKFLEQYNVIIRCTWYNSLPPPFHNDDQCGIEELEVVWPNIDQILNGTSIQ